METTETAGAALERETIITLSDGDDLVRIWTAQRSVITRLRRDDRFTETTNPARCAEGEAEFTIPRDRWSPVSGCKRTVNLSEEQRAERAERARRNFAK